jgi:hypothetical protein
MEYEDPLYEYKEGDYFRYARFRFSTEYVTAGGARIQRVDEKGHVSFWVPTYILNTFEYEPEQEGSQPEPEQ